MHRCISMGSSSSLVVSSSYNIQIHSTRLDTHEYFWLCYAFSVFFYFFNFFKNISNSSHHTGYRLQWRRNIYLLVRHLRIRFLCRSAHIILCYVVFVYNSAVAAYNTVLNYKISAATMHRLLAYIAYTAVTI